MTIKDNTGKSLSEASVIMAYFGRKEGQSLQDFMEEVRQLSPESKNELAIGAAKELGYAMAE